MKARLLPHIFKMIGFAIIVIPLIALILAVILNIFNLHDIISHNKQLFKEVGYSVIFTGFFLIISAKEKVEDEFADYCRMVAFRFSFLCGIVSIIFIPIPFMNTNNLDNSYHLLMIECITYLTIFYAAKKGLFRYGK